MKVALSNLKDTKQHKSIENEYKYIKIPYNFYATTGLSLEEYYVYAIIETFTLKGRLKRYSGSVVGLQVRLNKSYDAITRILNKLEAKGFIKAIPAGNGHRDFVALNRLADVAGKVSDALEGAKRGKYTSHTANEREYTQEDLDRLIDNIDDIVIELKKPDKKENPTCKKVEKKPPTVIKKKSPFDRLDRSDPEYLEKTRRQFNLAEDY